MQDVTFMPNLWDLHGCIEEELSALSEAQRAKSLFWFAVLSDEWQAATVTSPVDLKELANQRDRPGDRIASAPESAARTE